MAVDPNVYDIEIEHVTKRFGDFVAVKDMNLKIKKGEFFSMLGPSGCGKTTTLRMVAGFDQPTEGEIYLANVIAFDSQVCKELLVLRDGDTESIVGSLTPKIWTDKQGVSPPVVDLVAHKIMAMAP